MQIFDLFRVNHMKMVDAVNNIQVANIYLNYLIKLNRIDDAVKTLDLMFEGKYVFQYKNI